MPIVRWFDMRPSSRLVLAVAITGSTAAAQPSNELEADLFGALALTGHYCEDIDGVQAENSKDYIVTCSSGRKFRVSPGEGDRLAVTDLDGTTQAPAVDHDSLVRRHLFSIVNLSGKRCDRVTEWRHLSRLSYQLRCANNASFRILVGPNGRVIVAER